MPKFIIITGGVMSGLGKGILTASIGALFSSNYKRAVIKCDGYLNVDAGTMNPIEHGEVFVLDDGMECDMDFGHYERFMDVTARGNWNPTMGKIFKRVLEKERLGEYRGRNVQFVPDVTDEIKKWFFEVTEQEKAEIVFIEIGGTIGDLENGLYLEAVRQLSIEIGRENMMFIHLSYVPIPIGSSEQKSKPTQLSVKLLNQIGIWPDAIVCRCEEELTPKIKKKISLFGNVSENAIFSDVDLKSVYLLPCRLESQGFGELIKKKLNLEINKESVEDFCKIAKKSVDIESKPILCIGIAGKYTKLNDSYASIIEAIHHAATHLEINPKITFIDTEEIEKGKKVDELVKGLSGIIVPGGFGNRGWEGKIRIIEYSRENNIPFLGICLGLQAAVVEYARNVCGLIDANSTEMNPSTTNKVITMMDSQQKVVELGGSMRLGTYEANLRDSSIIEMLYGEKKVSERHRHRYEVNPAYHKALESAGMIISGASVDGKLVEFIELKNHPYFVATQAHPELKSKLQKPSPLFYGLLKSAKEKTKILA